MRRLIVLAAAVPLLAGCASSAYWYKPEVPPEIVARDTEECRKHAAAAAKAEQSGEDPVGRHHRGPKDPASEADQDTFKHCMTTKGYALVKGSRL